MSKYTNSSVFYVYQIQNLQSERTYFELSLSLLLIFSFVVPSSCHYNIKLRNKSSTNIYCHSSVFSDVVNITTNRTELVMDTWSSVEKSVIVVVLSIEMVLGILGNGLVLIVKIVVRSMIHLLPKCFCYFQSDLRGAITDHPHYYGLQYSPVFTHFLWIFKSVKSPTLFIPTLFIPFTQALILMQFGVITDMRGHHWHCRTVTS